MLKVFLKGGSSLTVRLSDGEAFYEKLTRRPVLGAMTRLHYNPGRWWTWFSDLFAVGLVAIVASGLLLLKGPKGLRGRGGVELAAGIAVPLLFLIFLKMFSISLGRRAGLVRGIPGRENEE